MIGSIRDSPYGWRKSLFRKQYNALGTLTFARDRAYRHRQIYRGTAFNRQRPFVDVLLSDIADRGEVAR
jgi:hypothetical protein